MPRYNLTELECKNAEPKDKDYRLPDRDGLYLLITTKGSKLWRYNYSFEAKKCILPLGIYPTVTLKKARELHAEAVKLKNGGFNPVDVRREAKEQKKAVQIKKVEAKA